MITIESDIDQAMAKLEAAIGEKQLKFSASKALNQTAYQIQGELRKNMPQRFTVRRPWVISGIQVERATKENLVATIYSRDKFMELQETGGDKDPLKKYLAVPTRAVRRTATQLVAKADRPRELMKLRGKKQQARAEIVEVKGDKYIALIKPRAGRSGNDIRLMWLLIPRAKLLARLGLEKDGLMVAKTNFLKNLEDAVAYAIRTARR